MSGVGWSLFRQFSREHGRDPASRRELLTQREKGDRQGNSNEGARKAP